MSNVTIPNVTRRSLMVGFVGYSMGRACYKCTTPVSIRTDRANKVRQYPLLYSEYAPHRDETRPLLLIDRMACVATSPVTTLTHLPQDIQAIEVMLRNEKDPGKFDLEHHLFFNKTYDNVVDYITS